MAFPSRHSGHNHADGVAGCALGKNPGLELISPGLSSTFGAVKAQMVMTMTMPVMPHKLSRALPESQGLPWHFASIRPLHRNKTASRKVLSSPRMSADLGVPLAETDELVVGLGASKAVWLECLFITTLHHSVSTNLISANLNT